MFFRNIFFIFVEIIFIFIAQTNAVLDRCRSHEFRCLNGKCIPLSYRCNGVGDCDDNSDEKCEKADLFICSNGNKILKSKLCDGNKDCTDDEDPTKCKLHKCLSSEFLCRTSPMKCVPIDSVCNNINNCQDSSDESPDACEFVRKSNILHCNDLHFPCASRKMCISKIFHCDKNNDCPDGSDESNCSITTPSPIINTCSENEFYCDPEQCIPKEYHCDSSIDCANGKDEENCQNFKCPQDRPIKCKSLEQCYNHLQVCDGINDCTDKTDEKNCTKSLIKTVCDPFKQFKCVKNNTCIDLKRVCDLIDDCGDMSDERPGGNPENCAKNPCEKENGNCEQICVNFHHMHKCMCKPGYMVNPKDETKCLDINECENEYTCSHNCTNLKGSFKCDCFEGFYKVNENGSVCLAVGEKFLLYSTKNSVRELRLLHHYMEVLSSPNDKSLTFKPVGIDFDYKSKLIFWSQFEPNPEIIQIGHSFAKTRDFRPISLVTTRINSPIGLAYDWIHGLLFWTDSHLNEISVLNITNRKRKVLLKLSSNSKIRAIVVHPKYRRIYWTDWGMEPKIESIGMDGNDRKTILTEGLRTPNGLTIDYHFNDLYWVDSKARIIGSFNLKTGVQKTISSFLDVHGFDIDIFEDWIYLSDWSKENIVQFHKKSGQKKILISAPKPMGLKLFHQLAQSPNVENVCINNPCQYLCLPTSLNLNNHVKYRCACPDYSVLLNDSVSCSPVPYEHFNLTKNGTVLSISGGKTKVNVHLVVAFVISLVVIVLILVVIIGIFMYRNYMHKVIKRASNFNNPTYFSKTYNPEIQLLYSPAPLIDDHLPNSEPILKQQQL